MPFVIRITQGSETEAFQVNDEDAERLWPGTDEERVRGAIAALKDRIHVKGQQVFGQLALAEFKERITDLN